MGRIDVSLVDPINDSSRSENPLRGMVVALQLDPGFHFPDVMPRTLTTQPALSLTGQRLRGDYGQSRPSLIQLLVAIAYGRRDPS